MTQYARTNGERPVKQWFGSYQAVVANNADPAGLRRVQLKVPQILGTAVTTWAVPLTPVGWAPPVNARVSVTFLGGDPDQPAYMWDAVTSYTALTLTNATASGSGISGFYYRTGPDGSLQLKWDITPTAATGTVVTLPASTGYHVQNVPSDWYGAGPSSYNNLFTPHFQVNSGGVVILAGMASLTSGVSLFGEWTLF